MRRFLVISGWILLLGILAFLGYTQWQLRQQVAHIQQIQGQQAPDSLPSVSNQNSPSQNTNGEPSLLALQASVAALQNQLTQIKQSNTQSSGQTTTAVSPAFQTQVVYLGSANTTATSWTNTGVQITLNSSDYPAGSSVVFQAGLSIVGGQAWARLVNSTTGAIMNITEVQNGSSTVTWVNSPNFQLFSGSNTYTIQMKSTSGEVAQLSGARLVIDK